MQNIISNSTGNKIKWVNFVGCLMIIFLHSTRYKYFDVSSLCAYFLDYFGLYLPEFGVPLFFAISGFLLFKDVSVSEKPIYVQYKEKMKSRFNSLLIPFFIYNVFWMMITIIEQAIPFINNHINSAIRFNYTVNDILQGIFLFKFNGVAWYIFFLMVYACFFFPFIAKIRKDMWGGILVILCAVLSCIKYPNGWIIGYIMHYNSLFFFVLGSVIATHRFNWVNKEYNRREIGVAFIVMLVITAIISFVPHEWEPVLMVLRTINVICVWICCDLFRNTAIPRFATITFFVYMLHGEVQKCINKIFEIVLPRNGDIFALINTFGGMVLT